MEASKFLKEYMRMCASIPCSECALCKTHSCLDDVDEDSTPEKIDFLVKAVDKWSAEHPMKTNIIKLGEIFGEKTASLAKGYAAGFFDEKVFKDELICWLGEEYKDVDKK